MSEGSGIRLSVVVPAYNEEIRLPGTLLHVLNYLDDQPYRAEVLVVDDGSRDGTAAVARRFSGRTTPVRLLQHADLANHGKGAAVHLGMLEAAGAFRLFMDADNSTTVDQVEGFWPWFEEGYSVVIGSRNMKGSEIPIRQVWYKELAGRLGNRFIRALAVPGIQDTQAGFKMFTASCSAALFPCLTIERWGYDIELLAVAREFGYRIREVPIRWVNAPGSKVRLSSYFEVLADVWTIRRNLRRGIYAPAAVKRPPEITGEDRA